MRRFLITCCVLALAFAVPVGADDTPKAAATRKKLQQKISVNYKDTLLRDVIEDLKEKVEGLGVLPDTKGGVNLNSKISFKAENKPFAEVLDEICTKNDMGYFIIAQQGGARDGNLKLTRGKERGFEDGQGPKDGGKGEEKGKGKGKTEEKAKAKTEDKPKDDEKPKTEDKPKEDDPEKEEGDAARKLKFAKELVTDKKIEKAKDRLEEIIKRYPRTKAGAEAKELLEKLNQ